MHSHADFNLIQSPLAESLVKQGVTSVVTGNCVFSLAPLKESSKPVSEAIVNGFADAGNPLKIKWNTFSEYLDFMRNTPIAVNMIPLTGFTSIRHSILGMENRDPTLEEIGEMKELPEEAMQSGSFGFSMGLIYAPQLYSKTEEIQEVAKISGKYNGMYFSHIRYEADYQINALEEFITIVELSNCRAGQLSHHKIAGEQNWGMSKATLKMLEEANSAGIQIRIDQYPYIRGSNMLTDSLPGWAREGGTEKMLERLRDEDLKVKIKSEMKPETGGILNWNLIFAVQVVKEEWKQYEGYSIQEISEKIQEDPFETFVKIILENEGNVAKTIEYGDEGDVERIMKHDLTMIGTDAIIENIGIGKPHPRSYGTYPRILGKYSRNQGVISFEEAIRKMTSYPAQTMGLKDRGIIREGTYADLVILNPETIIDTSDYMDPHQYPVGIDYVIVNGKIVVEQGEHTQRKPGMIITKDQSRF